jgi:hypothetical protein
MLLLSACLDSSEASAVGTRCGDSLRVSIRAYDLDTHWEAHWEAHWAAAYCRVYSQGLACDLDTHWVAYCRVYSQGLAYDLDRHCPPQEASIGLLLKR